MEETPDPKRLRDLLVDFYLQHDAEKLQNGLDINGIVMWTGRNGIDALNHVLKNQTGHTLNLQKNLGGAKKKAMRISTAFNPSKARVSNEQARAKILYSKIHYFYIRNDPSKLVNIHKLQKYAVSNGEEALNIELRKKYGQSLPKKLPNLAEQKQALQKNMVSHNGDTATLLKQLAEAPTTAPKKKRKRKGQTLRMSLQALPQTTNIVSRVSAATFVAPSGPAPAPPPTKQVSHRAMPPLPPKLEVEPGLFPGQSMMATNGEDDDDDEFTVVDDDFDEQAVMEELEEYFKYHDNEQLEAIDEYIDLYAEQGREHLNNMLANFYGENLDEFQQKAEHIQEQPAPMAPFQSNGATVLKGLQLPTFGFNPHQNDSHLSFVGNASTTGASEAGMQQIRGLKLATSNFQMPNPNGHVSFVGNASTVGMTEDSPRLLLTSSNDEQWQTPVQAKPMPTPSWHQPKPQPVIPPANNWTTSSAQQTKSQEPKQWKAPSPGKWQTPSTQAVPTPNQWNQKPQQETAKFKKPTKESNSQWKPPTVNQWKPPSLTAHSQPTQKSWQPPSKQTVQTPQGSKWNSPSTSNQHKEAKLLPAQSLGSMTGSQKKREPVKTTFAPPPLPNTKRPGAVQKETKTTQVTKALGNVGKSFKNRVKSLRSSMSLEKTVEKSIENGPCEHYRLDMLSKTFGMCVCGFPRNEHSYEARFGRQKGKVKGSFLKSTPYVSPSKHVVHQPRKANFQPAPVTANLSPVRKPELSEPIVRPTYATAHSKEEDLMKAPVPYTNPKPPKQSQQAVSATGRRKRGKKHGRGALNSRPNFRDTYGGPVV